MSTTVTARSKIHSLWEAFVPSFVFLAIYFAIFLYIVGSAPLIELQESLLDIGIRISTQDERDVLQEMELLKLLPFVALFSLAVVLYLFDKVALGVGHAVPPHPIWNGSGLSQLPPDRVAHLWVLLNRPEDIGEFQYHTEGLVSLARAEEREFLLGSLTWHEKRFNFAADLLAYGKGAVIWSLFCAFWAISRDRDFSIVVTALLEVTPLAFVFCLAALVFGTHYLVETLEHKLRVAESMLRLQHPDRKVSVSADDLQSLNTLLSESRRHRFIGLSWGSLYPFRRAVSFFARPESPAPNVGDAGDERPAKF